jgi:hypothetical protein
MVKKFILANSDTAKRLKRVKEVIALIIKVILETIQNGFNNCPLTQTTRTITQKLAKK